MRRMHVIAGPAFMGAAIALILTAATADARQRSGSFTGARGNTVSYNQTKSHANGVGTSSTTYTGPNGKSATSTVTKTPEGNGTVAVQRTYTGPNGTTTTRSNTVTH